MLDVTKTALIADWVTGDNGQWTYETDAGEVYTIEKYGDEFVVLFMEYSEEEQDWIGENTNWTIEEFCQRFGIKRLCA